MKFLRYLIVSVVSNPVGEFHEIQHSIIIIIYDLMSDKIQSNQVKTEHMAQ